MPYQYNASTYWKVGNTKLFIQSGLDPGKNHTVELIDTSNQMTMNLNDITLYAPNVTVAINRYCHLQASN